MLQSFVVSPGTGKTHLATGLGIRAYQAGHRAAFATAAEWVDRLALAHNGGRLHEELRRLGRYPVIVIDEVGYIPFEAEAANLFFQFISSRYERASVIVTSNKPFGKAHRFEPTCARWCLKRTGGLSGTRKSSSVNVVCQVADEPFGCHPERLADDFGVEDGYQVNNARRAEPFRGRSGRV